MTMTNGTYACPVCGLDRPHRHPVSATRWLDHKQAFFDGCRAIWPRGASHEHKPDGDTIKFYHTEVQQLWTAFKAGILAISTAAPAAPQADVLREARAHLSKWLKDEGLGCMLGPAERGALKALLTTPSAGAVSAGETRDALAKRLQAYYDDWAPRMRTKEVAYGATDWMWLAQHLVAIAVSTIEPELSDEWKERKAAAIRSLAAAHPAPQNPKDDAPSVRGSLAVSSPDVSEES